MADMNENKVEQHEEREKDLITEILDRADELFDMHRNVHDLIAKYREGGNKDTEAEEKTEDAPKDEAEAKDIDNAEDEGEKETDTEKEDKEDVKYRY